MIDTSTWLCTVFTLRLPDTFTRHLSDQRYGRERCLQLVQEPFRVHVNLLQIAVSSWEEKYTEELSSFLKNVSLSNPDLVCSFNVDPRERRTRRTNITKCLRSSGSLLRTSTYVKSNDST